MSLRHGLGRYARAQIEEISNDSVLRLFGAMLAATYVLSALHFLTASAVPMVSPQADPVCWPGLDICRSLRVLPPGALNALVLLLGALAIASAITFLTRRPRAGIALLIGSVILKAFFLSLDYRLRLNQHYMAGIATAVFLLVPHKRDGLRLIVALFYVWAGTIKLDHEWLSGGALYHSIWPLSGRWVQLACVWVVVLEIALVWALLSKRRLLFWTTLAQLALFHLASFQVVGFFYPLLMLHLLAIFPLCWIAEREGAASFLTRLVRGQVSPAVLGFALAMCLLQLIPHLLPGDTAITGQGRLLGLHMFDARIQCDGHLVVHNDKGESRVLRPERSFQRSTRVGCDPNLYVHFARNHCGRAVEDFGRVAEVDIRLRSRRSTSNQWVEVAHVEGFCRTPVSFAPFLPNDWIEP